MIRIIIFFAFLLLVTLLVFALCRISARSVPRQRAIITLYFTDFDCFEPSLMRIRRLYDNFDVTLRVIDMISTEESVRWLEKLSEKTDMDFDIIRK